MTTIPGPWFSEPRWRKAWLWTRYRLPSFPVNALNIALFLAHWIRFRGKDVDPRLSPSDVHPRIIVPILWRMEPHQMGRWYSVEWEAS